MLKVMDAYYIYMMTNSAGVLYIGIINNMSLRLWQHVHDRVPGFSSRYNPDRLVFYKVFPTAREAIAREKQLKGWRREKKTALIHTLPRVGVICQDGFRTITVLTCLIPRQARDDSAFI